jgi:hypothetical protein
MKFPTSKTLWLSGLLLGFTIAGCDCGEALLGPAQIEIEDETGLVHADADPWLVVDFGDVDEGSSADRTLTIRNQGDTALAIDEACLVAAATLEEAISPDASCIFGAAPFTFTDVTEGTILPADSAELLVRFEPEQGGPSGLFLRLSSNAANDPRAAVQLTGRGTAGRLCADNAVLDFGEVFIGESSTQQITLENCGLRPIDIDTYAVLNNPDDAFEILIDGSTPSAPMGPLDAGETIVLDVTFTPAQAMAYRDAFAGVVQLTTAAPFAAGYTLTLVGDGRLPPSCRVNVVPDTVQFGAVAANTTRTMQVVVQSVGECACTLDEIDGPNGSASFSLPSAPSLPVLLRGTRGCDDDPADADSAPANLLVDVDYTAPDIQVPAIENATLDITTSDEANPTTTVNLEANGGGAPFCELEVTPGQQGLIPVVGRDGEVEFGRVTIHFTKRKPIELTNVGNTECTIDGVFYALEENTLENEFGLEYEDGTPVEVGSFPGMTVLPGETARFMATFSPTEVIDADLGSIFSFGSYSGSYQEGSAIFCGNALTGPSERCNGVTFTTSDTVTVTESGVQGEFGIGFSATPVEPAIDVIPGEVDFGLVTLGCGSPLRRVTVYNTGSGDLIVGQPTTLPDINPAPFEAVANAPSFPHTIPAGGSMAIDVRYRAHVLGETTGELIIPTIEGGQEGPPVSVPLRGEGTTEREQDDVFDQFSDPKVDVLWVVDDSGSMSWVQTELANNFGQFFTASNVAAADFHIGVTTTLAFDELCTPSPTTGTVSCNENDMSGHWSACGGNDRYLTPASADPGGQFTCNVQVSGNTNPGRDGSDSAEAGLQAARNFLEPPNIDDPSINGGFLRDDAKLHVIMVSDEPDQSEGPIDLYVDFFRNIKGFRNESLVAVSAIAAPDGGCTVDAETGASGDARYETVVNELGGRFQSICDPDWTTMMSNLGLDSLGLKIEFFLSRAADPATLTVCVRDGGPSDGTCTPITQTADGQANGYFYDPTANSIVFNPNDVPVRGARIEVHYETACF